MAKRSKKGEGEQQRIFLNMLRPHDPKISLQIAKEHEAGQMPNLDQGLFSKDACKQLWQDAEDGKGPYPGLYNPVIMQLGKERKAIFGLQGKILDKAPANWPSKFGNWFEGAVLNDGRLMHDQDLHVNARIVDGALVAVGKHEYIVGTGGEEGMAAPYCIQASKTGNYSANERVKDRLTFTEVVTESGEKVTKTEFNTVVGQINNAPILLTLEDGREIAHFSNQVVTWGHLKEGDKVLTPTAIRALKGEGSGIKFVALTERWVGRAFDQAEFTKEVIREMKGADIRETDDGKSTLLERYEARPSKSEDKEKQGETKETVWNNLSNTQARCSIETVYCFGYRYAAIGKAIGRLVAEDGTVTVFGILGGHLTHGLSKTKWQASAEVKAEAAAAPAVEEKEEKKAAAPKNAPKKAAAKKATKKAAPKKAANAPKKGKQAETAVPTTETEAPAPTAEEQKVEADALGIDADAEPVTAE